MLGCTETITLVHHNKDDDDTYTCTVVKNASWHSKTTITTDANGAKPVNTYDVRIMDVSISPPALKDYCVKGVVESVEKPSDINGLEHFRITAIGKNNRAPLPHWRVSGQ